MHIYDVIIVGAGPIGLATGIGLRKRGIENLLVIDQARAFRRVGQVVDLLPNGLKALKCLDSQTYEDVKKTGLRFLTQASSSDENIEEQKPSKTSSEWVSRNLQGQRIRSISLKYDPTFRTSKSNINNYINNQFKTIVFNNQLSTLKLKLLLLLESLLDSNI